MEITQKQLKEIRVISKKLVHKEILDYCKKNKIAINYDLKVYLKI